MSNEKKKLKYGMQVDILLWKDTTVYLILSVNYTNIHNRMELTTYMG